MCIHRQHTPGTHTFPAWLTLASQWPSQSSVLTPMELISHGSTAHLLPQTLDASHIMLTRNTITSACLHFSCGTIKITRTRGCPVGCNASSSRFNVNLILSLEMLSSAQQTEERRLVIKGFGSTQMQCSYGQRLKKSKGYHFNSSWEAYKEM